MSRNALVAILGMVVFLVVAGAFYLEIAAAARATDVVWMTTRPVEAGDPLDQTNVQRTRIPRGGSTLDYYTQNLLKDPKRAAHEMSAGTILFGHDVLDQDDMALVNLTLRTPPSLAHGQSIDVYAQQGSQTMLVGHGLTVDQISGTNGTNASVWVKVADEPLWIALQAGNVTLFAARSTGVGVAQGGLSTQDAIRSLGGGISTGQPVVNPSPSPTPRKP